MFPLQRIVWAARTRSAVEPATGSHLPLCGVHGLATLLACGVLLTGCTHRRMTIRTDPPGAQVLVDGQPIGYTPASTDFTYYGTREITLIKPGYETLTVMQRVPPPWYQVPPLDFVTDNLLPFRVTNRHDFTYTLQPRRLVPTTELLGRANALRSEAQMGP
ncbi:MAG TPA: PEGA domain-containing protein [Planctomycetaceae bacterium]|nr:PEGA domain-containing protein [Planctomycetaceae bacterium]